MNTNLKSENEHRRVLVTPLNWGLGHVTRCIPLIQYLEQSGAKVYLASDGVALHLLKAEFPHLPTFELPSYNITYRNTNMVGNIARQLPQIIRAVRAEHHAIKKIVEANQITHILSDNRYGCHCKNVKNVILTHQLRLRVPNQLLQGLANWALKSYLGNFDEVWVPDNMDEPNLSGELSHGEAALQQHPNIRYIGILTRMKAYPLDREYDVAVVLSGPEPQRTLLEQQLLDQAMSLPQDFIFIQGNTQSKSHYYASENIEVVSFLTTNELNNALMSSRVVICRSGYSSLMDLAVLGKKAILIPTPGQTEQEYLAEMLAEQHVFIAQSQNKLDLEAGILELSNVKGIPTGQFSTDHFIGTLQKWLA